MKVLRRATVAVLVLTLMLCSAAHAPGLKQLPANPMVVIKIKSPEDISKKLADWSQKLGLANFDPAFGDPLGALKKQLNIKEGLDGKGEVLVAMYEQPQPTDEPLHGPQQNLHLHLGAGPGLGKVARHPRCGEREQQRGRLGILEMDRLRPKVFGLLTADPGDQRIDVGVGRHVGGHHPQLRAVAGKANASWLLPPATTSQTPDSLKSS